MDIPDSLIELKRAAEDGRAKLTGLVGDAHAAQWTAWYEATVAVQAAITAHAKEAGVNRYELERAVKAAVLHPAPAATDE
ncbi:hypothetical protein GCM10020367_21110 [Streptomyces sannanensis]|uniref:Uncharacterized protein n=1 Tax=Streptomyces sannanensis TaxID=285536 RepID=A0ABP6S9C2_9ACTN